jgi:hypothetical protein
MRQLKFRVWDKLDERFIKCDEGYQGYYVLSLKGEFHNLHKDREYEIVGNIFENSKLLEK